MGRKKQEDEVERENRLDQESDTCLKTKMSIIVSCFGSFEMAFGHLIEFCVIMNRTRSPRYYRHTIYSSSSLLHALSPADQ